MDLRLVSEDERRNLFEFGVGREWKVCKILETKQGCWVGRHYHKLKDEMFVLLKGTGTFILKEEGGYGEERRIEVLEAPVSLFVPRGTYHAFRLHPGSILIGLATELYNPYDDYLL